MKRDEYAVVVYEYCYGENTVYTFKTREQASDGLAKLYEAEIAKSEALGLEVVKSECRCDKDNAFIRWAGENFKDFEVVKIAN